MIIKNAIKFKQNDIISRRRVNKDVVNADIARTRKIEKIQPVVYPVSIINSCLKQFLNR